MAGIQSNCVLIVTVTQANDAFTLCFLMSADRLRRWSTIKKTSRRRMPFDGEADYVHIDWVPPQ